MDDVMIIDDDKENSIVRTPSPAKKPKQLTLFDMAKKSTNKSMGIENSHHTTSSSTPNPVLMKTPITQMEGAVASTKVLGERNTAEIQLEDAQNSKKSAKKASRSKQSIASPLNKSIDLENQFEKQNKENQVVTKKVIRISDFFQPKTPNDIEIYETPEVAEVLSKQPKIKVDKLSSSPGAALGEALKKPPPSITDLVREFGKRAFDHSDDQFGTLADHFADLLQVIQVYDLVMPSFAQFLNDTSLKYIPLEYEKLVQVLTDPSDENKMFYVDLIRRILLIFIYCEKAMPSTTSYYIDYERIGLDSVFVQELTRQLLYILLLEANYSKSNENQTTNFDLMQPPQNLLEQFPILKKLDTDLKCEPFGNLEPHEKLELLQLLCDHLLVTQEYQDFVESLETNIQKLKTSIDHDLNVLATKLNLERSELMYNKREKHFRKIEESNLPETIHQKKLLNQIRSKTEKRKADLKELKEHLRKEPEIKDTNGNSYWRFSFLDPVVVQLNKTSDDQAEEWYLLDYCAIKPLIQELQMKFEHRDLRKMLLDVYNQMKSERDAIEAEEERKRERAERAEKAQKAAAEAAEAREKRAILKKMEEEKPKEEEEPQQPQLRYSLRERKQVTTETESNEKHQENAGSRKNPKRSEKYIKNCEEEGENVDETSRRFCTITRKMRNSLGLSKLYSSPLLPVDFDLHYPIDDMIRNIANLSRLCMFYTTFGSNQSKYEQQIKPLILKARDAVDSDEKFKLIKQTVAEIYNSIPFPKFSGCFGIRTVLFAGQLTVHKGLKSAFAACQSMSQLYFLILLFMINCRRCLNSQDMKCEKCGLQNRPFTPITSSELKNFEEVESGDSIVEYRECYLCLKIFHPNCCQGKISRSGLNWKCDTCLKKKMRYDYVPVGEQQAEPRSESNSDSDEENEHQAASHRSQMDNDDHNDQDVNGGVARSKLRKNTKISYVGYFRECNSNRRNNQSSSSINTSASNTSVSNCSALTADASIASSRSNRYQADTNTTTTTRSGRVSKKPASYGRHGKLKQNEDEEEDDDDENSNHEPARKSQRVLRNKPHKSYTIKSDEDDD